MSKHPKSPQPPNVRLRKRIVRSPPAAPEVNMEEIKRVAREEALAGVQAALQGITGTTTDLVKEALREVLGELQLAPSSAPPPSENISEVKRPTGPEEPVYIPSDLVDKDVKADIKVQSKSSDSGGLDAAAAALKTTLPRRSRKKKGTDSQ